MHRWGLLSAWIAVFTVVVLLMVRDGREAHSVLCTVRGGAERQLAQNEAYLSVKGDPIVIYGLRVPRAELETAHALLAADVRRYRKLDC